MRIDNGRSDALTIASLVSWRSVITPSYTKKKPNIAFYIAKTHTHTRMRGKNSIVLVDKLTVIINKT